MNFSTMLTRLKNKPNHIAYREAWDSDRYLFIGYGANRHRVLYVHDGIHSYPYSVQQPDLFMNDWEVEIGKL